MMTFKEFYLQSSKGDKAPPQASRTKTPKRQNEILDRLAKLKAAKGSFRRSTLKHLAKSE